VTAERVAPGIGAGCRETGGRHRSTKHLIQCTHAIERCPQRHSPSVCLCPATQRSACVFAIGGGYSGLRSPLAPLRRQGMAVTSPAARWRSDASPGLAGWSATADRGLVPPLFPKRQATTEVLVTVATGTAGTVTPCCQSLAPSSAPQLGPLQCAGLFSTLGFYGDQAGALVLGRGVESQAGSARSQARLACSSSGSGSGRRCRCSGCRRSDAPRSYSLFKKLDVMAAAPHVSTKPRQVLQPIPRR